MNMPKRNLAVVSSVLRATWAALLLTTAPLGCGGEDAATAQVAPTGPPHLGEAVYLALCSRMATASDPGDVSGARSQALCAKGEAPDWALGAPLQALHEERPRLIAAIDAAIAPDVQPLLQGMLESLLPLHDDGTIRQGVDSAARTLLHLSNDANVMVGLGRLSGRQGYVVAHGSLARAALAGPEATELAFAVARVAARHPEPWAILADGAHVALTEHSRELCLTAKTVLQALNEPLLQQAENGNAALAPMCLVRRDARGLAVVDDGKPVSAPFVDLDHDGLADVDALGRFVDVLGRPLEGLPTPFARGGTAYDLGRTVYAPALRSDGTPWWSYLAPGASNLQQLLSAAAAYVPESWSSTNQAADGESARQGGEAGQAPNRGAALRLALDAGLQWAGALRPYRQPLAQQSLIVLDQHPERVVRAIELLAERPKLTFASTHSAPLIPGHAATALLKSVEIWLAQLASEPGLLEDVLGALAQPTTPALAFELGQQMLHSDHFDLDPDDINGPALGAWRTPTEPGATASTFDRLVHLVAATVHQPMCSAALEDPMPEYAPCALFEVPDVSVFYAESLAGRARLTLRIQADDFFFPDQFEGAKDDHPGKSEMEAFTGIDGFRHVLRPQQDDSASNHLTFDVAPQAASRLMFALHDPRVPADSAFGQTRTAVAQVTPRLRTPAGVPFDEAFGGTLFAWETEPFLRGIRPLAQAFVAHGRQDLLLGLLILWHTHGPAVLAEDAGFEARLGAALGQIEATNAVCKLLEAVLQAGLAGPSHPMAALANALRAGLPKPADSNLSPLMTLLSVGVKLFEEAPQQPAAEPSAQAAARAVMPLVRGLVGMAASLPPSSADGTDAAQPLVPARYIDAALTLLDALAGDPKAVQSAQALIARMMTSDQEPLLVSLADMLQLADELPRLAPLAAAVGAHLLGPHPTFVHGASVLQRLQPILDPNTGAAAGRVMTGLFSVANAPSAANMGAAAAEAPIDALWSIFMRVNSVQPANAAAAAEAADFAQAFAAANHFLSDDAHGLPRLLTVIEQRDQSRLAGGPLP